MSEIPCIADWHHQPVILQEKETLVSNHNARQIDNTMIYRSYEQIMKNNKQIRLVKIMKDEYLMNTNRVRIKSNNSPPL